LANFYLFYAHARDNVRRLAPFYLLYVPLYFRCFKGNVGTREF